MFKKDTRRGLALGAAFSLLASLFVSAPAAQADESGVVVAPFVGTSDTMLITEEFVLKTRLGLNVTATRQENVKYLIEKPAGYNVTVSNTVSSTIVDGITYPGADDSTVSALAAADTFSYVTPTGFSNTSVNQLRVSVWTGSGAVSVSKAVNVTVTAFLDIDPDGKLDKGSEPYETFVVKFVPWSALGASVTLAQPVAGAETVKATAAVTGVNFEQLNGDFELAFTTSYNVEAGVTDPYTESGSLNSFIAAGAMSGSAAVSGSADVDSSVSATLIYHTGDASGNDDLTAASVLAVSKLGVKVATIDDVTVSPVAGANLVASGSDEAKARINSTFALSAWGYTGSSVVAAQVPSFTFTTSAALSNNTYLVVNGVTYTTSAAVNAADVQLVAGSNGKGTITVQTVGFADGNSVSFTVAAENDDAEYTVHVQDIDWTVARSAGNFLTTTPGTAVSVVFDVEDQFEVASGLSDQTVQISVTGTGFTAQTISAAVVGGKATFNVTPLAATATGSLTVTPNLWYTNRSGVLTEESSATETAVTVYVLSSLANSTVTKPNASYSASISYGAAMSYSANITTAFALTGSTVVASATGVIFLYDSKTYSDTVTMTAGSGGSVTFKATSRLAGTYTISMVAGTATASTQLVVAAAAHDAGKTITYDKASLVAGATSTITGKLVDANGNPVATGGTASVAVTWTGKGLPFGNSAAMQTNKDGEFSFQVLVLSTEIGEAAVSATYMPAGSATDTKNLTFVQAISIVAPGASTAPSTDQKLTVGSFKGFVAIYALNYTGQKLSAKVAGKWLVVNSLSKFQRVVRNTGAGYTIKVDLHIDGAFVRSETVVTK
jgi:adhesin/invasin